MGKAGGGRPHGRDQIVAAVVAAATELFAQRGPAAVSLRDVAAAAQVTLSQIHRHIGNKTALLTAVLSDELGTTSDGQVVAGMDLVTFLKAIFGLAHPQTRTRLQARIILDGFDLLALQARYPGIELAVELLRQTLPEEQARARAAILAAFFAGWELLGPTYLRASGAGPVPADRLAEIISPLLEAMASAPPA